MRSGRATFGMTVLAALLASGVLSVACGSSNKSTSPTPQTTAEATSTVGGAPQQASVTIKDFSFSPSTVTIAVGGTVTWTNNGSSAHTVTADDGSFDSGDLSQGKTYSHTFDTAGTFAYHCSIHPNMKAEVVVGQSGSSASSSISGY